MSAVWVRDQSPLASDSDWEEFSSDKNIKPVNNSEGDKIKFILTADFVLAAHG